MLDIPGLPLLYLLLLYLGTFVYYSDKVVSGGVFQKGTWLAFLVWTVFFFFLWTITPHEISKMFIILSTKSINLVTALSQFCVLISVSSLLLQFINQFFFFFGFLFGLPSISLILLCEIFKKIHLLHEFLDWISAFLCECPFFVCVCFVTH